MSRDIFDAIVIGAGSGGSAFAKRAAGHGARVAIIEGADFGGTCVNVGCVPKKIMWWASQVQEFVEHAGEYGVQTKITGPIDWSSLKSRRDASVIRLRKIYEDGLIKSGVTCFKGYASFADYTHPTNAQELSDKPWRVRVESAGNVIQEVLANHAIIATGSQSTKLNVAGEDSCTNTSDYLFSMTSLPKKIAVIGAGYIAVEFAGLLRGLGTEVHLFIRGETVLRKFDEMVSTAVTKNLAKQGVLLHKNCQIEKFSRESNNRFVHLKGSESARGPFDVIIVAVGRSPKLGPLHLTQLGPGLEFLPSGGIRVDDYQNTSLPRLYAIGDVTQKVELTPMAIAAGRRLADRLFLKGFGQAKANYDNVPSVIFSHPPVGTVGISEADARKKFGSKVLVYTNTSINLYYNVFDLPPDQKPRTLIKLICVLAGADEVVMGIHVVGMGADEMIQGFGYAIGMTKAHLDSVVAVHPSAAEEVVTCQPWGLPHLDNDVLRPLSTSIGEDNELKSRSSFPEEN